MAWKFRRVDALPTLTEPDTSYFVRDANDPTIATQYVTGADGSPRLAGGPGLYGSQGPQGIQGETGPAGPIGPTGAQGPTGATGPQGLTGPQGDAGPQGPSGPQGAAGPKGDTGDMGATGPAGPAGIQGLNGDPGAGVPVGGVTGQALTKVSNDDYDAEWSDLASMAVAWADVTGRPTFSTVATSGAYADLTGLPSLGSAASAAVADFATAAQGGLASSALQAGAVIPWTDVSGKPSFFDGSYSSLSGVPSTFAPSAHSHAYADLTGLPSLFDGAYGSLSGIPATFTPATHTHAYADLTGIPTLFSGAYADLTGKPALGTAAAAATVDFAAAIHTHAGYQDTLVSGTNIKTIGGESVLGTGDFELFRGLALPMKPAAGVFVGMATSGGALGTVAQVANRNTASPFVPAYDMTIDQVAISISTAVAASLAKVVIYDADANGRPNAVLAESANVDCATVGTKASALSMTMQAGKLYWVGVRANSTQTLRSLTAAAFPVLSYTNAATPVIQTSLVKSETYATAAAAWGYSSAHHSNITMPIVLMRIV